MSNNVCRVCANRSNFCLPIDTKCESLPFHVIVQVILPIRILDDDSLPKEICAECYNIVLNAYKLRERSLISDKLLKDKLERQSEDSEHSSQRQGPAAKRSRVDLDRSQPSPKPDSLIRQQQTKKVKIPSRPSTSKGPNRRSTNDSSSMGEFPDSTNRSDDYPAASGSNLLRKKQEEIINQLYEGLINPPLSDDPDKKPLRCEEVACANSHKLFESEDLLKIHKAFEHGGFLKEPTMHPIYYVRPEVQSESYMRAFGMLCFKNGKTCDKEHLYCKLCISKGVVIKFALLTEPTVLLAHVLSHLEGFKLPNDANDEAINPKQERSGDESVVRDENQDDESLLIEQDVVDLISDDELSSLVDEDIDYSYAPTKLGNLKLLIGGYSFAKKHDSATAQYYKCIKRVSWDFQEIFLMIL